MTETTGGGAEGVFGWCKEKADSREAQMITKCKFLNLPQSTCRWHEVFRTSEKAVTLDLTAIYFSSSNKL